MQQGMQTEYVQGHLLEVVHLDDQGGGKRLLLIELIRDHVQWRNLLFVVLDV
jgi:hypothetical protein